MNFFAGTLTIQTLNNGTYSTTFHHPKNGVEERLFENLFKLVDYLKRTELVVHEWQNGEQDKDAPWEIWKSPNWSDL